jgi:tetratricopeptide (TPR) repeat protein
MKAPRYEARAYPYFNLARVYERRGNWLEAVKNYGLALREQSNYIDAYKALKRLQSKLN